MLRLSRLIRQLSYTRYGPNMDVISPPVNVRGMKVLDKDLFKKTIQVGCVICNVDKIRKVEALLKGYFMKLQRFKPIQKYEEQDDVKIIYLDPDRVKCYLDLSEKVRNELLLLGIMENSLIIRDFTLCYDNYKADDILRAIIPSEEESVSGYSMIGHIVHLNLREHLYEYKQIIGQVLLDKVSNAKTVITKSDIIDTEFRHFKMELLAGEDSFVTKVKEHGCQFELDFSTVYWNPRLSTEHSSIVSLLNKGDVLFDVFAGIGPFSVPAAKKGVRVFANDLNPESVAWLKRNIKLNKLSSDVITVTNKDGAEFIKEDFKRELIKLDEGNYKILITMNLPSLADGFLAHFKGLFTQEVKDKLTSLPVPQAFVYCFTKNAEEPAAAAKSKISDKIGSEDAVGTPHFVRNVAPNKDMYRVPLSLVPSILLSRKRNASED